MGLDDNNTGPDSGLASGDVYLYSATSHAHSLLASVHTLREREGGLCDVTLRAGDRSIQAHKVILAASSPYFNAMFTNRHRESFASAIDLNGIDAETLENLITFIYSSSLEITEHNVQNLLSGAGLLQLASVIEACCRFLQARVCADNCLGIAAFADLHGCSKLHKYAWTFTVENFAEVVRTEEFLSIPAPLLIELVKCDDLQIQGEEEVLDCVIDWLRQDEEGRILVAMEALEHVKLPLIPWKSLYSKWSKISSLGQNPICQSYLESAKSHQSGPSSPTAGVFKPSQYVPRRSVGRNMFIYAVGGETNPGRSTVSSIEQFDPTKNSWQTLAAMNTCRRGVGVGILNGYLYTVGGSDGIKALKLAERYDPSCDTWTRITDMNEKRSSVAATILGDYFYAVGGYNGETSCLQSAERYNPNTDTWSYVASMHIARSMACACSLEGRTFVVGGYDGISDLQSCEVFSPETNTWAVIESMKTRRCMADVVTVDGLLYVAGGCDHAVSLKSVESYDPSTGKWAELAGMSEARSGLGLAVIGRKIFATGGHNGMGNDGYCSTVEQYNPETNVWSVVAHMTRGRRRFGCCS